MEISQFAPVLIPTLNRYEHLRRCVESLSRCTHADKTDLYIALDYPANDSHWEGYNKIKDYLNEISGFKSVNIIIRDKNFGATQNFTDAREQIFQKYDRIIFSEDDNEFSPNFLDYINKGLDKFENDENVLAVCGYQFPLLKSRIVANYNNYYYYRSFSAWGVGIWKSKWRVFQFSPVILEKSLKNWKNALNLYKRNPGSLLTILNFIKNKKDLYGDMAIGFYMSLNTQCHCIFPVISKVRNYGHDGSGIHCGVITNDFFISQEIDTKTEFEYSFFDTEFDKIIKKEVFKYFDIRNRRKILIFYKYLIFLIKHKLLRIFYEKR